ncbi:phosphatidate cytidylyltransferase [Coriobacteriia bacterium Es71-Z0120]|uniref:phosphatidate cytidylyltransferase n=1 Tax=Parvivirga hydrogeniphila TaxID=2939460 RepID=UPI00226092F8|nr:phosphatidate cytidylyltransferase [Parvivirga hydrogeniphila]MCL4079590.1 phosphatidate cytidylyltransferase [Parvivirga hydrogeniphila]
MARTRPLKDFWARVASALAIGVAFLGAIFFGGPYGLAAVAAVVGALAATELFALFRREHRLPNEVFGIAAVLAMPFAAAMHGLSGLGATFGALIVASLAWHLAFPRVKASDTAATVFGAAYVGFSLAHLVLIRELDAGTELVLATVVSVWANDSFAYLIGSTVGRHKMAPTISPKKSWEGFVAGTLFTTAVWAVTGAVADVGLPLGAMAAVGLAASGAAVLGDLAESRLKREAGVKDSGRLLPGHGGFLDRFDSMIVVAIVAYYALIAAGAR